MTIESTITTMAKAARDAAHKLGHVSSEQKNTALFSIAAGLKKEADFIRAENHKDLLRAEEMGLSGAMIDRLTVKAATIDAMVAGLKEVARLNDPVGTMGPTWIRPNGLQIARMRIPLGVIGIIYESRPNVTVDAAGLCLHHRTGSGEFRAAGQISSGGAGSGARGDLCTFKPGSIC